MDILARVKPKGSEDYEIMLIFDFQKKCIGGIENFNPFRDKLLFSDILSPKQIVDNCFENGKFEQLYPYLKEGLAISDSPNNRWYISKVLGDEIVAVDVYNCKTFWKFRTTFKFIETISIKEFEKLHPNAKWGRVIKH